MSCQTGFNNKWKQLQYGWIADSSISIHRGFARWKNGDSELIDCHEVQLFFIPSGGPDFSNANIFILMPVNIFWSDWACGNRPDLCDMPVEQINRYLEEVNFHLGYFQTQLFHYRNMIGPWKKQFERKLFPLFSVYREKTDIISSQ